MTIGWLTDIKNAIPSLAVLPHLRHRVIQHLMSTNQNADKFEAVAYHYSAGQLRIYMSMIQYLLNMSRLSIKKFTHYCSHSDDAHDCLTNVSNGRNVLIKELTDMEFTCNDVPETRDSIRQCRVCHGSNLLTHARQTRSADEGQTIFFACNNKKCSAYGKEFR